MMLLSRAVASSAARAAARHSSRGARASCAIPGNMSFHSSAKREEEAVAKPPAILPAEGKGGLFGTGLSEWFALPLGVAAAVPFIKLEWYIVNEETQLLAVFLAFCVTFYTQGGDAVYKALDQRAVDLLEEHTQAEDKVLEALEKKLVFLRANQTMVADFKAINDDRAATYEKLNAAGAIKPQHDLKTQVERMLALIAAEETSVAERAKAGLMAEATAAVTGKFARDKAAKKAALDAAIAQLKGGKAGADPVRAAFVQFFKDKAAEAEASKDDSEEKAQRAAMIAKLNAVAKSENCFFQFNAQGKPVML